MTVPGKPADAHAHYSEKHPHEPEIPPALDDEGRCLVCGLLVRIDALLAELAAAQRERSVACEWAAELAGAKRQAERERDQARDALARAVYLAEHLWAMVPQAEWRDHGGDDGQGHYEGDYHAEQVAAELKTLAALGGAAEEQ